MIKRFVLFTLLLALFINLKIAGQSKAEIRNNFYEAESSVLFEDYKEALPLYLQLLKSYPDNANYKYRIGQCYINIPGEKGKAISYLEDAVRNIDPNYHEGKFSEAGAPYDALYYLANAYRITNQLDKAIDTYEKFKKNLDTDIYDSVIVNLQISSCRNAKELMKMPLFIKKTNLGKMINGTGSEFNPVVSDKEDMIVFSRGEAFYDALLYSTKVNGKWTGPINMNEILKVDRDIFPSSLSRDGKTLYLYSSADYDGTIYTSKFENDTWQPLVRLNDNINTKYWESHATISHDNKKLYFTSNRKGSFGGLDIYVSKRDSTGDWSPAVNLGSVINSPYNEESPFLTQDDKTLFFSSRGHFNMGGYDIFYSTLLDNGEWSVPMNVGYPLNSTDDDVFFKAQNQGYEGYYAIESPGSTEKQEIYRIEIFSDDHPRKFFVRGVVKVADLLSNFKDSVRVSAMNIKNPNQLLIVYSNPKTGEYEFQLPQGNYEISYESKGGKKVVKNVDLPLLNPSDSFVLPGTVLPKTDFVAELAVNSNKKISVAKGDTIMFPLKVEPESILTVEHWVGDSLINVEKITVQDSTYNYKVVPDRGNNKIVFKLTDKYNNSTSTDVFIEREKHITAQPLIRPEYKRVIAKKQIEALTTMILSHSDNKLKNIIEGADINKHEFGKIDDLISYLKEQAVREGVSTEEIDKLALKVAVMDNVLTQTAVDLMAKYAEGDLKKILSELDIYQANLKTWTDLQAYIEEKTGGKISQKDLNDLASAILMDIDPSISLIREKILAASRNFEKGNIIRQSVETVDLRNIKLKERWLEEFYDESIKEGLSQSQMAKILAMISSLPETNVEQFLSDLIDNSEEPLTSSLKSIDLTKEKIKSPGDLLLYLLKNKDRFQLESVFKAIGNLATSKDIPVTTIESETINVRKNWLWVIWILAGSGLFILFIILWKKRKNKKK